MTELVILSGKGGTGKTSLTAAFVDLFHQGHASQKLVLVDADVDAANLDLLLFPQIQKKRYYWGGLVAKIDPDCCQGCGTCKEVCRFEAVLGKEDVFQIDPIKCEGCAACFYQCPQEAISLDQNLAGEWYRSEISAGTFFHAALIPAQENSGKLVSLIKEQARKWFESGDYALRLIDGPPGTGCPVIAALSGADAALIVAEPSLSGIHDLGRALETTAHFGIKTYLCINKCDIRPEGGMEILRLCRSEGVEILGEIPYDLAVPRSMALGKPVTRSFPDSRAARSIDELWNNLYQKLSSWHGTSQQIVNYIN